MDLITGANKGIGKVIAERLSQQRYALVYGGKAALEEDCCPSKDSSFSLGTVEKEVFDGL
jgi:NAD(P)-dependent dehydrogenase (short-subunit alcohol dehydrogenase family)